MATTPDGSAVDQVADLIDGVKVAMLTTVEDDGTLHTRPMTTQEVRFDGTLWFFLDADSAVAREAARNTRVAVAYADTGSDVYVSVAGTAAVVRDPGRIDELWRPTLKAWFPQGRETPGIALLRVDVERAEWWDASKPVVAKAVGLITSLVRHERAQPGEHGAASV